MIISKIVPASHKVNLSLLALLLIMLLGLFWRVELNITSGRLGSPLDDAWIHYQFARNLAHGDGFSFNPGQPTPGSTAPLWTLLLAVVGLFTADFLVPSLLLSSFFLLLAVWLTYGFARELFNDDRPIWPLLAGLGVVLTGRLLWAGLSGMETNAFAAVSLGAVWAYHRQGMRPFPALLFGLASQLRPEGHALFALAVADSLLPANLFGMRRPTQLDKRALLISIAIYAVIIAPYILFSLSTTGKPLPNTFYAKADTEHVFSFRAFWETLVVHFRDNPVAFLLIPFGIGAALRKNRLIVLWLVSLPILTGFILITILHHGRYTMPLIPFQMIVAVLGAKQLAQYVKKTVKANENRRFLPEAALILLVVLFMGGGALRLPHWATMLGNNANEILEIDVALGHWLAENTPPDALIAVDDIGAITFLSQRRIIDLFGLVSPEMWPVNQGEAFGRPRNEAAARLLSTLKPDYMVIFPTWHWEIAANPVTSMPVKQVQVETRTIIAHSEAYVYKMRWPYLQEAAPQVNRMVNLGEAIELLGYDFAQPQTTAQPLSLTLYWHSLAPVSENYDIFIHVWDEAGNIVAQADSQPVASLAPTHRWQPGDIIRDPYEIFLPANLPPGAYRVYVGMYLKATGTRLPVTDPDAVENALFLTTFDWQP